MMKINPHLYQALTLTRNASDKVNIEKINNYIKDVITKSGSKYFQDDYGNIFVFNQSKTLLTSHTDTVHGARVHGKQKLVYGNGYLMLAEPKAGYVLGADDGAGLAIMLELISRGNTNYDYVFYQDEEIGGLGSNWSAKNNPAIYAQYNHAISLDRKGTSDVINWQSTGYCCSHEFAEALAARLGNDWKPTKGVFTDSANLVHLIPECTNLSVGYYKAHTKDEYLDYNFWLELVDKLDKLDTNLPISVKPKDEYDSYDLWGSWADTYGHYNGSNLTDEDDGYYYYTHTIDKHYNVYLNRGRSSVENLVRSNPDEAVKLICELFEEI